MTTRRSPVLETAISSHCSAPRILDRSSVTCVPVPLEYSTEGLASPIASGPVAVMVAGRVLLKIVYLLTWRVLGAALLVFRGDGAKTAELLVLRH